MRFPEHLEQLFVADLLRVEHHEHRLGVVGEAGADLFIRGIPGLAARITDRGRVHARRLPEHALRAPEAAQAELRELHAFGERRLERMAVDEMLRGHAHLARAPGQRALLGEERLHLLHERKHHPRIAP